jgi:hypothetical protein
VLIQPRFAPKTCTPMASAPILKIRSLITRLWPVFPFAAFVLGFCVEVGKLFLRSKGEPFSYLMACPQCLETDI